MTNGCIECNEYLEKKVYHYSIENFGAPLCYHHQHWIRGVQTTDFARDLYFALRQRGVPAQLEKDDGFKSIDIAIPECKINIEVDGKHHNTNAKQALADLKRTYHSFLKGYYTLRIPNSLIAYDIEETADYIVDFLNASGRRQWKRWW